MKTWRSNKINVAIQVLPEAEGKLKYELVDKAIEALDVGLPLVVQTRPARPRRRCAALAGRPTQGQKGRAR